MNDDRDRRPRKHFGPHVRFERPLLFATSAMKQRGNSFVKVGFKRNDGCYVFFRCTKAQSLKIIAKKVSKVYWLKTKVWVF